jgi:hypothetical protein
LNATEWPATPIRLSVPVTELHWLRHSWAWVPLMILSVYLIVVLVAAVRLGLAEAPDYVLGGLGAAGFVAVVQYFLFRRDTSGLSETALLYHDRIVLVRDGREIPVQWGDVISVSQSWVGKRYWARIPVELDCRVDGNRVRLCFFPRRDREFEHWGLGDPIAALSTLSGQNRKTP